MDEGETVVFRNDDEKRAALLAWMQRVDVDAVILNVLEERYRMRVRWQAMRKRWMSDPDR